MKALVIGRGETSAKVGGFDLYVGVNDCQFPVDHLICIDAPFVFSHDRLSTIAKHPAKMYTQIAAWGELRQIEPIRLTSTRYDLSELKLKQNYPHSNNSPFVAVCHAYFMGAKTIVLSGVDMVSHPVLSHKSKVDGIKKHYSELHRELAKLGCKLYLLKDYGILSGIVPVIPKGVGY